MKKNKNQTKENREEIEVENENDELEQRKIRSDFGVHIEEAMGEYCSSYECVVSDEHDIGMLWSFLIDDSISGFVGIEDNEEGLGIETVTIGIHLKEISDFDRDELMGILELNSELINACFTVAHIQEKVEEEPEPVFAEEGESIEYEDNEQDSEDEEITNTKEILLIQCKIPLSAFDASDFSGVVQNLMMQSDFALNQNTEELE